MERFRRSLLVLFAVGLGASITLSQASLAALTLLWLGACVIRRAAPPSGCRSWGPCWLLAATLASAMAAASPSRPWWRRRGLLVPRSLGDADLLSDPESAAVARICSRWSPRSRRGRSGPGGLLSRELERGTLGRWFFHRCDRPVCFLSIYMTLAASLVLMLLATAPRTHRPGPRRWRAVAVWGVMVAGLAPPYARQPGSASPRDPRPSALPARGGWRLAGVLLVLVGSGWPDPMSCRSGPQDGRPEEAGVKERVYMCAAPPMCGGAAVLGCGPGGVKRLYAGSRCRTLQEAPATCTPPRSNPRRSAA